MDNHREQFINHFIKRGISCFLCDRNQLVNKYIYGKIFNEGLLKSHSKMNSILIVDERGAICQILRNLTHKRNIL